MIDTKDEGLRQAVYMALHYYMSVQNPNEWEATDKAIEAMSKHVAGTTAPAPAIAWHEDVRFRVHVSSVAQAQDTDEFEPAFKRLSGYIEARRAADRNAVLEEVAAWYADKGYFLDESDIADAIRAFKVVSNAATAVPGDLPPLDVIVAELSKELPASEVEFPQHWEAYRSAWSLRAFVVQSCINRVKKLAAPSNSPVGAQEKE